MIYTKGDLGNVFFLGILRDGETVEIKKETISRGKNLYTNPSYKRLSLVDRYAPRVDGDMTAKFEWK